eukprot:TRINITY_DN319_c0_g1_i5.p1 TRINITY_DN319_c0_g1~~TRINITY_DN319_c0_g1_i5.p1  ORF type:complete len:104 (+),score=20.36 TRINITY_DN319_c0_g1_i5:3-314(+)
MCSVSVSDLSMIAFVLFFFFFFFSSRRRHTRSCLVSWARRCVQETDIYTHFNMYVSEQLKVIFQLKKILLHYIYYIYILFLIKKENDSQIILQLQQLLPHIFT